MSHECPGALSQVLRIRLTADAVLRTGMIDALRGIAEPTRADPRCLQFGIYLAVDNPEELTLMEEWESLEAVTEHFRSTDFRTILSVIDLSTSAPEIRLDTVMSTQGIEQLIEFQTK